MAVTPVSGVDQISGATAGGEAAFDAALENAQGGMTPELEQMMIEGAVTVGGQMIIMPRANDILNEAMSDE